MSVQENKMKAIADAIREKDGTTEPIQANDFPDRIRAISAIPPDVRTITLEAEPPEGGAVSGGGIASTGMTVTVSAVAGSRYNFIGWKENGEKVSEDAEYTFSIENDRTLQADFSYSILPDGYTAVEYIASGNGQYIDTGIVLSPTLRIVVKSQQLESSTSESRQTIVGIATRSGGSGAYRFTNFKLTQNKSGYVALYVQSNSTNVNGSTRYDANAPENEAVQIDCNQPVSTLLANNEEIHITIPSSYTNSVSLYLFAEHYYFIGVYPPEKSSMPGQIKMFSCQIYDSGEIVRNFAPCVNESGIAGLYDLCEGKFYTSLKSGYDFVAGPAV